MARVGLQNLTSQTTHPPTPVDMDCCSATTGQSIAKRETYAKGTKQKWIEAWNEDDLHPPMEDDLKVIKIE